VLLTSNVPSWKNSDKELKSKSFHNTTGKPQFVSTPEQTMSNKDHREVVNPGDKAQVRALEVSLEKRQIALTMKSGEIRPPAKGSSDTRGSTSYGGGQRPRNGSSKPTQSYNAAAQSQSIGNNPFANLGAMLKK